MQNELDVVRDVSQRLDGAGFAYMLTGSMAMNYYAQPRMTRDIDLVVALAPRDVETVVRLFEPDYYISREAVTDSIALESFFKPDSSGKRNQSGLHHPEGQPVPPRRIRAPPADHHRGLLHLDC
jgi:hypothetical protein